MSIGMVMKEAGRSTESLHARRFEGIVRPYPQADVERLRGSVRIEHTLAELRRAAALGAAPHRATTSTRSARSPATRRCSRCAPGLKAIYLSGWQVAADANTAGADVPRPEPLPGRLACPTWCGGSTTRCSAPTRSSTPRARTTRDWFAPIVADAEAGFGGAAQRVRADEGDDRGRRRRRALRGPARVARRSAATWAARCWCRRAQFIRKLVAARLAADVLGVPTLVRRAHRRRQRRSCSPRDIDERDQPFITGERTAEGFYRIKSGLEQAIARGLAYAPYADLVWCETVARRTSRRRKQFAEAIHAKFPGKMLAYNCSPSFNWKKNLDDATIAKFQRELGAMGYKFQFVTLAGFHALNYSMFELARELRASDGMAAFVELQQAEFARRERRLHRDASTSARSAPATSTRSTQVDRGRRGVDDGAARARPRTSSSSTRDRSRQGGLSAGLSMRP